MAQGNDKTDFEEDLEKEPRMKEEEEKRAGGAQTYQLYEADRRETEE